MGDRDLEQLKQLLKDVELGAPDWHEKPVLVPKKPRGRNNDQDVKEWRCKSNVAIFLHMQKLKDIGLPDKEFDVQECKGTSSSIRENVTSTMRRRRKRYYDEEGRSKYCIGPFPIERASYPQLELRRIGQIGREQNNVPSRGSSIKRVSRDNLKLNIRLHPAVLPPRFREKMMELGGSEESIKIVIRKELTSTDVDRHQARLSIPPRQIVNPFLTPDEMELLLVDSDKYIGAMFIEPSCDEHCEIKVQKWKSSNVYQLVKPWANVVQRNNLEAKMEVEIWSFRVDHQLGLALVLV